MRGWLYTLLRNDAPEAHDAQLTPFTLATFDHQALQLRISLFSPQLCRTLAPILSTLSGQTLRLGRVTYTISQAHQQSATTYAKLLEALPSADAPLRFVTPTFFRKSGGNYPLPEPALVFGSLAQRWQAFAPEPVPDNVQHTLSSRVTLKYLNLSSVTSQAHAKTVGFVGRVTFHLPKASPPERRWLSALTHYSVYAGVGAKTTLGYGQVRPYTPPSPSQPSL